MTLASGMPAKLIQQRAEVFGQRGNDLLSRSVHSSEPQPFGVECQAVHQRPFGLAGRGPIISLKGAQKYARRRSRSRRVVEGIDRKRQADVAKVDADLMGLAGLREDTEQGEGPERFLHFPKRACRAAAMLHDSHALGTAGMWGQSGVDLALRFGGTASHQREVLFFDGIGLKLLGKMPLGPDVFGKCQNAAGAFVEAVHDTKPRVGGARRGQAQLPAEALENAIVLTPARNAGQAGRFGHGGVICIRPQHIQIIFRSHAPSVSGGLAREPNRG